MKNYTKYVMVAPAILFIFCLTIYPSAYMFYLAFTRYNIQMMDAPKFVGLNNFVEMASDYFFLLSARATFYFVAGAVVVEFFFALFLALLIGTRPFRGSKLVRLLILTPMMLPPVAIGAIMRLMLNEQVGLYTYLLSFIGLGKLGWLGGSETMSMWSIILTDTYQWAPFGFLILLAGIYSIPTEIYESARIDGASGLRATWHITLPMLRPAMIIALVLNLTRLYQVFDYVYVLTGGGPAHTTSVLPYWIYKQTFWAGEFGYGAAMSLVMLAIVGVTIAIVIWQVKLTRYLGFAAEVEKLERPGVWSRVGEKLSDVVSRIGDVVSRVASSQSSVSPPKKEEAYKVVKVHRRRRLASGVVFYVIVTIVCILYALPLYWALNTSFQGDLEPFSKPPVLWSSNALGNTRNYLLLIDPSLKGTAGNVLYTFVGILPQMLLNTIYIVPVSSAIAVFIGCLAAYSIARFRTGGLRLFNWFLSSRFLPPIVAIVPLTITWQALHLYNTLLGVIIALWFITIPLSIMMLVPFFRDVPKEVEESAEIDGAGIWTRFLRISIPITVHGIVAAFILCLIFSWNQLLLPLVLTYTRSAQTMPIMISAFVTFQEQIPWNVICAASILNMIPVMALVLLVEKYLVRGLTMGAVKG